MFSNKVVCIKSKLRPFGTNTLKNMLDNVYINEQINMKYKIQFSNIKKE